MGDVYIINKESFKVTEGSINLMVLKEILNEDEAKDLIEIQRIIASEVSEDIHLLKAEALTTKSIMTAEGFMVCLAMEDKKCVGYGYGYIENSSDCFYIDTIGVHPMYRNKKIGTEIKIELIRYAFESLNMNWVKAITQPENIRTININRKLGFIRPSEA